MPEKTCSRCKDPKLLVEMAKQVGSPDGLSSWCKKCYRESSKPRNLERARAKQEALNILKSHPCADCSQVFPPCCMDFDHVRGEKRNSIGRLLTCSNEVILSEINKCDLVCAVCHRIRTHSRGSSTSHRFQAFYEKLEVLKSNPCADCCNRFPPCCMDFDHIRGPKVYPIARMYTCSWDRVLIEISKCDLICANCHRIRTKSRGLMAA